MTAKTWSLNPGCGDLLIKTDVAGPASRLGHRLTIVMRSWQAIAEWRGRTPVSADLTVDVNSLEVLKGDGGLKPLGGPEQSLIRANALKSLGAKEYPTIRFSSTRIDATSGGYCLDGELQIHGHTRAQQVAIAVTAVGAAHSIDAAVTLTQSDFGVKPYSLMMGTLKVADPVNVVFHAVHGRTGTA